MSEVMRLTRFDVARLPVRFNGQIRAVGALLLSTLALVSTNNRAEAATIGDTSDTPYAGYGAWITSAPSGPYISRAQEGDDIDIATVSDSGDYVQGLITDKESGIKVCGFVEKRYVEGAKNDPPNADNPCKKELATKDKFESFAKGINYCETRSGKKIMCVDGAKFEFTQACNFYKGFAPAVREFDNINYPDEGSGPYGLVARKVTGIGYYRFVRDETDGEYKQYAAVRTDKLGWGWVRKVCIEGYPDGGTPKTPATKPGHNPNGSDKRSEAAESAETAEAGTENIVGATRMKFMQRLTGLL